MGTSEEIRNDQHYRHHASHNNNNSNHPGMLLAHPSSTPSSTPSTSAVHAYKLADDDSTHDHHEHHQQGHGVAMEVDPSCDYNEPKSPSPTHYGSSAFPYAEQQQQNYAGLVATPITRFLTKQTFGFIPKPSFPSPSDGIGRSTPSSPALQSAQSKLQALRLPSLLPPGSGNSSLPQSPLQSPQPPPSFSLPAGETLSRLFNSASLDAGSAPSTPTASRGSTVTLPPLKRACPSPTTPLPPLAQQLSLDDICKPFRYQRSLSCPSDTMARAAAEEAAYEAYSAPRALLQFADVPKNRLERSNSMDVGAVLAAREAHARALHGDSGPNGYESSSHQYSTPMDYQGWLDRPHMNRHPLASLAESAHAMQRLEQHDSNHLESPRGATSPSESGGESSTNPFAINAEEFKREKKLCAFPQCSSNAVTRGLCISHGGGRRCQRKGCTRGAQSKGLCVAHGGGRICRAKGCSNIQRSMGLCIRHGGGKRCSVAGCQKGVVRQDLCTAHGGKRKCRVEDCNKHVKKKGLCRSHANSVLGASAMSPSHDYMSDHSD